MVFLDITDKVETLGTLVILETQATQETLRQLYVELSLAGLEAMLELGVMLDQAEVQELAVAEARQYKTAMQTVQYLVELEEMVLDLAVQVYLVVAIL